jgi:hypothetical protein
MDWIYALARLGRPGDQPRGLVADGDVVHCPVRGDTLIVECRSCPRFVELNRDVLYCRAERPGSAAPPWS